MLLALVSAVQPIWIGVIAFAILFISLLIMRGMTSGRPHS